MTASQREKVIPSFDFVSDPETRKMVRNAYKYGPLSMTKLQQFLTPERSAALEQDLRPEHMLQDLASEFPEVMEMIAAEREANAVAETVDSSAHVSHSAAQAASITFEKDKEGASSFKDLPPAVASMLSTSARVNTSATSEWLTTPSTEPVPSATTYHDRTEPISRATFPGNKTRDNEIGAFKKGLDTPELPLDERMRLHSDFSAEMEQFKDASPTARYFAHICATSLGNNPFISAEQKKGFFFNLRALAEGDFDPMDDNVPIWPEENPKGDKTAA